MAREIDPMAVARSSLLQACTRAGLAPLDDGGRLHLPLAQGLGPVAIRLDVIDGTSVGARLATAVAPLVAGGTRREAQLLASLWCSGILVAGRCTLDPAGRILVLEGEAVAAPERLGEEAVARLVLMRLEEPLLAMVLSAAAAGLPARAALARALAGPPAFSSPAALAEAARLTGHHE
jgi:hypothetical protein